MPLLVSRQALEDAVDRRTILRLRDPPFHRSLAETWGEFANETVFVTSKHAISETRILRGLVGDRIGFAVLSDGAAESLVMRQARAVAPAVSTMLSWFDGRVCTDVAGAVRNTLRTRLTKRTPDDCSLGLLSCSARPVSARTVSRGTETPV